MQPRADQSWEGSILLGIESTEIRISSAFPLKKFGIGANYTSMTIGISRTIKPTLDKPSSQFLFSLMMSIYKEISLLINRV